MEKLQSCTKPSVWCLLCKCYLQQISLFSKSCFSFLSFQKTTLDGEASSSVSMATVPDMDHMDPADLIIDPCCPVHGHLYSSESAVDSVHVNHHDWEDGAVLHAAGGALENSSQSTLPVPQMDSAQPHADPGANPVPIGCPVISEIPVDIGRPVISDIPVDMGRPVISDIPVDMGRPVISDIPVDIGGGTVISDIPADIARTVISDIPVDIERPILSDIPVDSNDAETCRNDSTAGKKTEIGKAKLSKQKQENVFSESLLLAPKNDTKKVVGKDTTSVRRRQGKKLRKCRTRPKDSSGINALGTKVKDKGTIICNICSKSFAFKRCLRVHLLKRHINIDSRVPKKTFPNGHSQLKDGRKQSRVCRSKTRDGNNRVRHGDGQNGVGNGGGRKSIDEDNEKRIRNEDDINRIGNGNSEIRIGNGVGIKRTRNEGGEKIMGIVGGKKRIRDEDGEKGLGNMDSEKRITNEDDRESIVNEDDEAIIRTEDGERMIRNQDGEKKIMNEDCEQRIRNEDEDGEKNDMLQCHTCSKRMSTRFALSCHLRLHSGEKPYRCTQCPKRYVSSSALRTHEVIQHSEARHRCRFCKKQFRSEYGLKSHVKSSDKWSRFCTSCRKQFWKKCQYQTHACLSHGGEAVEKRIGNEDGGKGVRNGDEKRIGNEANENKTEGSEKTIRTEDGKMRIRNRHDEKRIENGDGKKRIRGEDNEESIRNGDSERRIGNEDDKKRTRAGDSEKRIGIMDDRKRMRDEDGEKRIRNRDGEKRITNEDGENRTVNKDDETVIRTEDGEKRTRSHDDEKRIRNEDHEKSIRNEDEDGEENDILQCHVCSKRMSGRFALRCHLRLHSGEKPYACTQCPKRYISFSALRKHKVITHSEARFKCRYCKKLFRSKRKVKSHTKILDKRSRACTFCQKQFRMTCQYNTHVCLSHGNEASEKRIENQDGGKRIGNDGGEMRIGDNENGIGNEDGEKGVRHEDGEMRAGNEAGKNEIRNGSEIIRTGDGEKRIRNEESEKRIRTEDGAKNDKLRCHVCSKRMSTKITLRNHLRLHSGEKPYQCTQCPKSYASAASLRTHEVYQHSEATHSCRFCKKLFWSKKKLKVHENPTDRRCRSCLFCREQFRRKCQYRTHTCFTLGREGGKRGFGSRVVEKKIVHEASEKKLVNDDDKNRIGNEDGGRGARNEDDVKRIGNEDDEKRVKIEDGEKNDKLQCHVCSKRLFTRRTLLCHLRLHSGEKPYQCTQCSKRYALLASLRNHELDKHSEATHQCKFCEKLFPTKRKLIWHLRSRSRRCHTCPLCGKLFRKKCQYDRHVCIWHGSEDDDTTHGIKTTQDRTHGVKAADGIEDPIRLLPEEIEDDNSTSVNPGCPLNGQTGLKDEELEPVVANADAVQADGDAEPVADGQIPELASGTETGSKSVTGCEDASAWIPDTGTVERKAIPCENSDEQVGKGVRTLRMRDRSCGDGDETKADEKRAQCPVCCKSVADSYLRQHMKLHSGDKPYQCTLCPTSFTFFDALKNHVMYHAKHKYGYQCTFCKQQFRNKHARRYFKRHLKVADAAFGKYTVMCRGCF